jgi:hypothetical protein
MSKLTAAEVQKILTTDARTKLFKEKLKKLGYVKDAKMVNAVMEKTADFGMMSDAGNKKIARAVAKAKNEKDLLAKIEKIANMSGGSKYSEAQEDEVIDRAIDAFNSKAAGMQLRPDANMLMQLRKFTDTKRNDEVRTDDMKKIKVKYKDAIKVHDALMTLKAPIRDKYTRLLQKDAKSFKKTFKDILKVAS